jgi:hypothetical protein
MVRNPNILSRVLALALLAGAMASVVYAGTGATQVDQGTDWGQIINCPPGSGVPCGAPYGKRCDKVDPGKTCKDVIGGCKCKG